VKDPPAARKRIAVLASTNTWAAYNPWPFQFADARSIFFYDHGIIQSYPNLTEWPAVTTFLRPNPVADPGLWDVLAERDGYGPYLRTEHLAAGEIYILRWLELNGYSYSMLTDDDLHRMSAITPVDPLEPAITPTVIISTHSEYWTPEMYFALRTYQDRGGNIVSLSGNTMFHPVAYGGAPGTTSWGLRNPLAPSSIDVWHDPERASLVGIGGESATAPMTCGPYTMTHPAHWAYNGTPSGVGVAIGRSGELDIQNTLDGELAGQRSYCGNEPASGGGGGASGWEMDVVTPSFARTYSRLATGSDSYGSGLVFMKKTAGEVFSVASITFGQSLLFDFYHESTHVLTQLLKNVLGRFSHRTRSDFGPSVPAVAASLAPDLLAINTATPSARSALWYYKGDNAGNLVPGRTLVDSGGWGPINDIFPVGDMNSDGYSDILIKDTSGNLSLVHGHGDGTVSAAVAIAPVGWGGPFGHYMTAAPGDFDGDGRPDLLSVDYGGIMTLFPSNGADGFATPVGVASPSLPAMGGLGFWAQFDQLLPVGDFDGDGKADLIAREASGARGLSFCPGDGGGGFLNSSPCSHMPGTSGWWSYVRMTSVGNFTGSFIAKPSFIGQDGNGHLWLWSGDGHGGLEAGPATYFNSGWNIYSVLVGVW
jgi:hypothetical protein